MDDLASAKHEAAHAIVAWMLGAKITRATIVGPMRGFNSVGSLSDSACFVSLKMPGGERERLEAADLLGYVAVAVAPGICDKERSGQLESATAYEAYLAAKFLTNPDPAVQGLVGVAQKLFVEHGDDVLTIGQKFFEASAIGARELLSSPGARRALDELTAALLARGSLTGVETAEIIETAWASDARPAKALPLTDHSSGFSEKNSAIDRLAAIARLLEVAIDIADATAPENSDRETAGIEAARCGLLRARLVVENGLSSLGLAHGF